MKFSRVIFVIILMFIMFSIVSCGIPVKDNQVVEYEISNNDMLEEYDKIWEILEKNYPYLEILESKGINVEKIKSGYKELVKNAESFDEYFQIVSKMIQTSLNMEGHLYLFDSLNFRALQSAYENPETSKISETKVYKYIQEPFFDNNVIQRYNLMLDRNSTNGLDLLRYNNEPEIVKKSASKILIIKYESFFIENREKNREIINNALHEQDYDTILIDIRNNYGGALYAWLDIVEQLIDENICVEEYYLSKGIESKEIYNESYFVTATLAKDIDENYSVYNVPYEIESKKEITYSPKIYLLLNQYSYSSSLKFAQFSKDFNFAKIVSREKLSGGDGGSGYGYNLLTFKLPKSNLLLQFYSNVRSDENGEILETVISPDVTVPNNASYEEIIKIIRMSNQ